MDGHAQAALEAKEGAERALADFEAGSTVNPFSPSEGTGNRHAAWNRRTALLTCRRDHDPVRCCQEHDRHLGGMWRYQWGLGSCTACEAEVEAARVTARFNEPHDHEAQWCICWSMGAYAQRVCRGTCHLEEQEPQGHLPDSAP